MAGRPGENEKMPDEMAVGNAAIPEKNQTGGVGDAAGQKPDHRFQRDRLDERTDDDEDNPAHAEIENERQFFQPNAGPEFYDHAEDSEHPNEREHRPAQGATERPEGERRVSPGDQEKNRGVIDDLERAFPPRLRPGVVERRAKIKQPHRDDEDDRPDVERLTRLPRRGHAKKRCSHDRRRQAETVADAIGDFFAAGLVPFRRRKQFVDRFHVLARAVIIRFASL